MSSLSLSFHLYVMGGVGDVKTSTHPSSRFPYGSPWASARPLSPDPTISLPDLPPSLSRGAQVSCPQMPAHAVLSPWRTSPAPVVSAQSPRKSVRTNR